MRTNMRDCAQDVVNVCGDKKKAIELLESLKYQFKYDEIKKKIEISWPENSKDLGHISPSNEEMLMQFIVECGGYEEAETLLKSR